MANEAALQRPRANVMLRLQVCRCGRTGATTRHAARSIKLPKPRLLYSGGTTASALASTAHSASSTRPGAVPLHAAARQAAAARGSASAAASAPR